MMKKKTFRLILPAAIVATLCTAPTNAQAQEFPTIQQRATQAAQDFHSAVYNLVGSSQNAASQVATNIYTAIDPLVPDNAVYQSNLDAMHTQAQQAIDGASASAQAALGAPVQSHASQAPVQPQVDSQEPVSQAVPYSTPAPQQTTPSASSQAILSTAQSMVGAGGYDCSGFVQAAYAKQGISLPRTSWQQKGAGTPVSTSSLVPGDIVFFYGDGHVGIYAGGGQVIHSPGAGHNVVYENINHMPISGAVRVV